jgi:nitroreductase
MDYFELLRYRRSTRKFTKEQISQDDLSAIITAANSAPVGSNMYRDIHLTVVQNRDALEELAQAAVKRWENKAKMKEIVGSTPNVELDRKTIDPFYGAPTVSSYPTESKRCSPALSLQTPRA